MSEINYLQELKDNEVSLTYEGSSHVKIKCPFHDDTNPTMSVKVAKDESDTPLGWAKCFACSASVAFAQLIAEFTHKPVVEIGKYLIKKYNLASDESAIDPKIVDLYHNRIWEAGPLLEQLRRRAISDESIKRYKLGEDNGRITIPIFSETGRCVNIIRYLPGATTRKFINAKGRGNLRLNPVSQLDFDTVVLAGGPIKAYAGASFLNQHNIGCISTTGGELDWSSEFNKRFEGKTVYVCMDVDGAGRKASLSRCRNLYSYAKSVHDILLPFPSPQDYPKGGLDDFIACGGDLLATLQNSTAWQPPQLAEAVLEDTDPLETTVTKAFDPKLIGQRLSMPVTVTAVAETPYFLPKKFSVTCSKDAKPDGICELCPVMKIKEGQLFEKEIHPESKGLLGMLDKRDSSQYKEMAASAGIPSQCKRHAIKVTDHLIAEDVRISPMLDLQDTTTERVDQPAIVVNYKVDANSSYEFVGRMYPHPDTQKATLVVSSSESIGDDITSWECEDKNSLKVFQPTEWTLESLEKKLDDIYSFLEMNVTYIYERRNMHILNDLVGHSALFVPYGNRIWKGWVEALIIGDSSQGKTEMTLAMRDYYDLGERIDCKNATVAGLLGGATALGSSKKLFVKWGHYPRNDRKWIILEELKGAHQDVISKLTDMRSSGVAQLPKIESKKTKARVRTTAVSNPRSPRPMSTYSFGVAAVMELIGAPEDIRRFDAVMAVGARGYIPERPIIEPSKQYTQELFRNCVLNAWTVHVENIDISEVESEIKEVAKRFCKKYSEDACPIVDSGSMHLKITRLATALALRTYSMEGNVCRVRKCHLEFIEKFLYSLYDDKVLGYEDYSKGLRLLRQIRNEEEVLAELQKVPFAPYLVENLLQEGMFEQQDLMDWGGITQEQAKNLVSTFVRCRCIVRKTQRAYVKTPGFIDWLKTIDVDKFSKPPKEEY